MTISALLVTLIVSVVIPAAVAVVTKSTASTSTKQIVTAFFAALNGLIVNHTLDDGTAFVTKTAALLALGSFIAATASYVGLYKPHNADARIVPTTGIG